MAARISVSQKHYKLWTAAAAACFATLIVGALILPKSFGLTALSDVIQCVLLFSGTMALVPQIIGSSGRLRLFWTLLATGITFWFSYQLFWTYYEVWLRQDVPDLFAGDIVLFLHIVPMIAAVALRPHAPEDEYAARLRRLDFALMMAVWIYLYVFSVIPWQYIIANIDAYDRNLNSLYLVEKLALLCALVMGWMGSKGRWRTFYANLFGASLLYGGSSYAANWALSRNSYYSGSLYDIPLVASIAWITLIGLWTRAREPQSDIRPTSTVDSVWLARLGMIAAFSLPLFGAWALLDTAVPMPIRSFRLVLTLSAAILMGGMVFVRQRLLDRELLRLLSHSQESFTNLKRLQAQITESEKLASIGQLVGGAAHELNNPITAMLGYSDLLVLSRPLNNEQNQLAAKIGQHARLTKSLVASLLSFAKPTPIALAPLDLNTLLRTAVKLSQSQWQTLPIDVRIELPKEGLLVRGDSNQLLQVFVQVINDVLRALDQRGVSTLMISAQPRIDFAMIQIFSIGVSTKEKDKKFDSLQVPSNLGLSACQAILRQHQGQILCPQDQNAEISIIIEIPLIGSVAEKSTATAPGKWEPQPSA
jgi:signal transduction histidine kinase